MRVAFAGFAALLLCATTASAAEKYLSIDPNKIIKIFGLKKVERTTAASLKDLADSNPDDFVWTASDSPRDIIIFMAGQGEKIYSLRIWVPVVNLPQKKNDEVFRKIDLLFSSLAPDWKGAGKWPEESLGVSWKAVADAMASPPGNIAAFIPLKVADGMTFSTFGIPPDLVTYYVTTRDACIPRMNPAKPKESPLQPLVCK